MSDSRRHFSSAAPTLARTCPALSHAIIAIASLHSSLLSANEGDRHNTSTALRHHDHCIELMVPMLSDRTHAQDDALSLTCIILALYEDLEWGSDSQRHVYGTSLFLSPTSLTSPLRKAAFWCHLRQEIYAACSKQRPILLDLDVCPVDKHFEEADGFVWVHRALWICGLVVQWSFGDNLSISSWQELVTKVARWMSHVPISFLPIYKREPDPGDGRWFPDICFATDEQVSGVQFITLAKLLLVTHDPSIPRIGPRMKIALSEMQDRARSLVFELCGMGLSNNYIPAGFIGMLAMRMCGGLFEDDEERRQLIGLLHVIEKKSGWPSALAEGRLRKEWGWDTEAGQPNGTTNEQQRV